MAVAVATVGIGPIGKAMAASTAAPALVAVGGAVAGHGAIAEGAVWSGAGHGVTSHDFR